MKRNIIYACMLLLMTVLAGCTHNKGDIGDLFGQWRLEQVLINDVPLQGYDSNVYWSFQNTTVQIKVVNGNEAQSCYGNWREADNTMFIDFPDDAGQDYSALPLIKMSRNTQLAIIQGDKRNMVLQHTPDATTIITYKFKKW